MRPPRDRSHGADSRHLRPARAHARRPAAGRARAAAVPAAAPGRIERRRCRGWAAASARAALAKRNSKPTAGASGSASPASSATSRDVGRRRELSARAAPAHRRAHGRARRLHERRQDHAVQPADGRDARTRPTRCSSRSIRSCAACGCPTRARCSCRTRSASSIGCRTSSSRRFTRRSRKWSAADLLLHVIDAAAPDRDRRIDAVRSVLAEVGAEAVPVVEVFNKIDLRRRRRDGAALERASAGGAALGDPRHGPGPSSSTSWRGGWRWTPSGCASSSTQAGRRDRRLVADLYRHARVVSHVTDEWTGPDRGGRAATARRPLRPGEGARMTGRAFTRVLSGGRRGRGDRRVRDEERAGAALAVRARLSAVSDAGGAGRAARGAGASHGACPRVGRAAGGRSARAPSASSPRSSRPRRRSIRPRPASGSRSWRRSSSSRRPRTSRPRWRRTIATCRRWQGQAERRARRRATTAEAIAALERILAIDPNAGDGAERVWSCCASGKCRRSSRPAGRRGCGPPRRGADELRAGADALAVERGDLPRAGAASRPRAARSIEAEAHARRAIQLDPSDADALRRARRVLEARGKFREAAAAFAARPPDRPEARVEVDARTRCRDKADMAAVPAEFRSLGTAPTVTRGQLAALVGIRLEPRARQGHRSASRPWRPTCAGTGPRPGSCR